ncbi:glutathione S-transferase family protein [Swingsia samuiensis]|uniref:Glutathione S-transferase family protein n=1 Tax=Swingsia samuiensis TaxID=1293412 RepID=A0A4Y6UJC0_9PROT|nr:glutathione S-transferase family protein [Swingsia samuiensis]QDH17154.1 glutathione S-transferase family protein [Swingsia samuiensis]
MTGTLYLGSRRYSSWSLRGWLAIRLAGIDVVERVIPLKGQGRTTEIHALSPNKLVPYLQHEGADIWESLAICEYAAEYKPSLWPEERGARAHARSVSAQMHAGFRVVRQTCPMDLERKSKPLVDMAADLLADVELLKRTLENALMRTGEQTRYLFGSDLTIADCMYAPIAIRVMNYQLPVGAIVMAWCETMLDHPLMREWANLAYQEPDEWRLFYS